MWEVYVVLTVALLMFGVGYKQVLYNPTFDISDEIHSKAPLVFFYLVAINGLSLYTLLKTPLAQKR